MFVIKTHDFKTGRDLYFVGYSTENKEAVWGKITDDSIILYSDELTAQIKASKISESDEIDAWVSDWPEKDDE